MKVLKFEYMKDSAIKNYEIVQLKESAEDIEGISVADLPEDKKEVLKKIVLEFEKQLEPYMKNYRKFKKFKMKF